MRQHIATLVLVLACMGLVLGCTAAAPGPAGGEWTSIAQAPGAPGANFTTPRQAATSIARPAPTQPAAAAPAPQEQPAPEMPAPELPPAVETPPSMEPATPAQPVQAEAEDFTFRFSVGDEVDVRIWREDDLSAVHRVLPDGTISPPLLDPVRIEGMTIREVRSELLPRYKRYIKDPRISVRVTSVHSSRVFVLGEVTEPAAVLATGRVSLLAAISQAGGFAMETADRQRVRIVRPTRNGRARVITVNVDQIVAGRASDVPLRSGDVVFVPTTGLSDWSRRLSQLFGPIGTMLGSVGSVAATVVAIESLND
ncbi:MAG: polysaccharide biosynthesis/export family protein [Planctomycetota bacterium]|nr:polysaccharide biosynthesis/export family protein [Planctomycetota bacterium]